MPSVTTTEDAISRAVAAIWHAQLQDMPIEEVCEFLRGQGYNVSDKPREWWEYHHRDCGTLYRGCAPGCPKDTFERTGEWIGPGAVALPITETADRILCARLASALCLIATAYHPATRRWPMATFPSMGRIAGRE
jgi:hypothetical protein